MELPQPVEDLGAAAVKRTARRAGGVTDRLSPHWLRHAHDSHAIDHGASLPRCRRRLALMAVAWLLLVGAESAPAPGS